MIPIARVLAVTALLGLLPLHGAVAAAYKWVDDKGEVQFSQTPPAAGTSYEVIKTPTSSAPAAAAPENTAPSAATPATTSPAAAKAEDAAIRAKNCAGARRNLEILKGSDEEVTIKDANGLLHTLSADERAARRQDAEKNIKEYCQY